MQGTVKPTTGDLSRYFKYGQWRGSSETICGKGSSLAYTAPLRERLAELFRDLKIKTLLDAPCGDFNWIKTLKLGNIRYTGLDIVDQIVTENSAKFGNSRRKFFKSDITKDPLPAADLILVRDCMFHLPFANIADFLENYLRSGIRYLLITNNSNAVNANLAVPGQYRPVNFVKPPFSFPEPPPEWRLRDYPDGQPERYMYLWTRDEIAPILNSEFLAALRSFPPPANGGKAARPNIRAGKAKTYLPAYIKSSKFPETLADVISTSRDRLGFFSAHPPRAFEYPWMIEHIPKTQGLVIDLGAGLSPIPFMLAERGSKVLTVDYSSIIRTPANRAQWNEWGFLDYSTIDNRIESRNIDFSKLDLPDGTADAVYSVSVIEHMPAEIRRSMARTTGRILKSGGSFVLTLDLVPNTHKLWNFNLGKRVEEPALHGQLNDFISELGSAGLFLEFLSIERGLPGASTDIACMLARKVTSA